MASEHRNRTALGDTSSRAAIGVPQRLRIAAGSIAVAAARLPQPRTKATRFYPHGNGTVTDAHDAVVRALQDARSFESLRVRSNRSRSRIVHRSNCSTE